MRKIAHVLFLLLFCLAFFMPNCALGAEGGAASQIVDSSAPVLDITLYASSTSVPADNTTVSYIVAEVRDGAGNLVPGSEVTFQVAQGQGYSPLPPSRPIRPKTPIREAALLLPSSLPNPGIQQYCASMIFRIVHCSSLSPLSITSLSLTRPCRPWDTI